VSKTFDTHLTHLVIFRGVDSSYDLCTGPLSWNIFARSIYYGLSVLEKYVLISQLELEEIFNHAGKDLKTPKK
jgi:hypothetical protein